MNKTYKIVLFFWPGIEWHNVCQQSEVHIVHKGRHQGCFVCQLPCNPHAATLFNRSEGFCILKL